MSLFFKSKNKIKNVLVFDIGSSSVGGSVVSISEKYNKIKPDIIKSIRDEMVERGDVSFDILLKDMLNSLNDVVNFIYNSKTGVPEEAFCVLASPWYLSEIRNIKYSRETPFVFTNKLASELLQKEINLMNISYEKKYSDSDSIPSLIENHIMEVIVDGVSDFSPLGKKVKSIEMNVIISLCPKVLLNKINEIISKTFLQIPITFSSFMADSYLAVRDQHIGIDSYLLMDIGGEVTDVTLIKNNIIKSSITFPSGKRSIFNYLSNELRVELRDAKELFKLFMSNNLSIDLDKKISMSLNSIRDIWAKKFIESFMILPYAPSDIPSIIFVTVDDDVNKWFTSILETNKNIKTFFDERKIVIVTLAPSVFIDSFNNSNLKDDLFLMIDSVALFKKLNK